MKKKEIWKLLELFKEYVDKYWTDTKDLEKEYGVIDDGQGFLYWTREYSYLTLISKSFWFIQRLVEQDKIRDDGIKPRKDLVKEITIVDYKTGDAIWWKNKYTEVEQLIMYLSIQDEPIRFLCEIIK
jgi:hypothetical protein